jgi:hypothetical protein
MRLLCKKVYNISRTELERKRYLDRLMKNSTVLCLKHQNA